jgi:diphthine-ammonia ligase
MPDRPRAAISWSGGKDCCLALHRVAARYDVVAAVTMFDEAQERSRSHGLRPALVAAQVERLGLRHVTGGCSWLTYTDAFIAALQTLQADAITHVIFGDIMFDDHRQWTERVCGAAGLTAVQPIWGEPTELLLREFLGSGGEALMVTVRQQYLDRSWLGCRLSEDVAAKLIARGIDPCGERGEYHTLVTNSLMFSRPLAVRYAGVVERSGCWALDVELDDDDARTMTAGTGQAQC